MLKKDLFVMLGLPFTIKFSKVRMLKVKVPYTNLSSQPVQITLDSLILVVEPLPRQEWKVSDSWSFDNKRKMLEDFIQLMQEQIKN